MKGDRALTMHTYSSIMKITAIHNCRHIWLKNRYDYQYIWVLFFCIKTTCSSRYISVEYIYSTWMSMCNIEYWTFVYLSYLWKPRQWFNVGIKKILRCHWLNCAVHTDMWNTNGSDKKILMYCNYKGFVFLSSKRYLSS